MTDTSKSEVHAIIVRKKRRLEQLDEQIRSSRSLINQAQAAIAKAEEEKGHIQYMLADLEVKEREEDDIQFMLSDVEVKHPATTEEEVSRPNKPTPFRDRAKIYREIFEESNGREMTANEIWQILQERGYPLKRSTHHSNLSQFNKSPIMPIEQVRLGIYRYNPSKVASPVPLS